MGPLLELLKLHQSKFEEYNELLRNPKTVLEKELLKGPVIVTKEKAITSNRILLPVIPGETFEPPLEGNPILVDVWPIKCTTTVLISAGSPLSFKLTDGIETAIAKANLPFEVSRISKSCSAFPFGGEVRSMCEKMKTTKNGEVVMETTIWVLRLRE